MSVADTLEPHRTSGGARGAIRFALGAILVAGGVYLMVVEASFRTVEARLVAVVVQWFTVGGTNSAADTVYFGLGTGEVHGIVITTLCSSVVLVTPLLALAGVLTWIPSFRLPRIAAGLVIALVIAVACNVARYTASAFALQSWGMGGFTVVHEYIGSLGVIAGFVVAFVLLLRLAIGPRRDRTRA